MKYVIIGILALFLLAEWSRRYSSETDIKIYESELNLAQNEVKIYCDSILYINKQLVIYKDSINSLNEQLFLAKFKLERIREYNRIAGNKNQLQFLRGWINRVLTD